MRRRALLLLPLALPAALLPPPPLQAPPSWQAPPSLQAPPSFRYDVLPALQRHGCASAYCHGSATGRGGFKLSLFGSDPAADWRALAVDQDGRRLDLAAPERSLVLQKPTAAVPHGGGRRFGRSDEGYRRLSAWIAAGAPDDADAPPPRLCLQRQGEQLQALATFADGSERDVTGLCQFAATDERVVTVDEDGALAFAGQGEAFVTARYAGADAVLRVLQPAGAAGEADGAAPAPSDGEADAALGTDAGHSGDRAWLSWLGELGLRPAAAAPPAALARRLWLDLLGRPPAPHELQAFLALPPATAVAQTATALLAGDEFVAAATDRLCQWFEVPDAAAEPAERQGQARQLRQQLQRAVAERLPLPALGRQLLQLGQPLLERFGDPRDRAEFIARSFLGVRLGCARCHDHPNDRWRLADHQGFASLVATRRGADGALEPATVHDDDGREVPPRPLPFGRDPPPGLDPWAQLRFCAFDGGDQFARNVGNRIFAWLLGEGLVTPVDDHRLPNPPRCAPLLAAMLAEWQRCGGDLRQLLRWVVTSRVYAAGSEPLRDADADALALRCLARRSAHALDAGRLQRSIAFVLGAPTPPALAGSPLPRALALQNGGWLAAAVAAPGNPVLAIADFTPERPAMLRELFLLVLSRPPSAAEQAALLPRIDGDCRAALQQLAQALIQTREFGSLR